MKLLFVSNGLVGGGAEKLLNDLLPRLLIYNYEVHLLILTDYEEKYLASLERNNVKVIIVPHKIKTHLGKIRFIKKTIKNNSYDVVHANLFPSFYYCAIAKALSKRFPKLVLTEHNTDNRRRHKSYLRPLEKWIYRRFDRVISISQGTQDALLKWLSPKDKKPFIVIENGVPLVDFFSASPYKKCQLEQSISEDDLLVCLVGSFTEQKNHDLAIRLLKKLPQKYKMIFVGEGPLFSKIHNDVQINELNERVYFLGFRKDVASVIKTCDISFIPSKWEGFGLVAVEAMACKKPIIAANVPGLKEVIDDAGILCAPNDEESFLNAFLEFEREERRREYGARAIVRASAFEIENMVKKYKAIYNLLIRG